MTIDRDRTPGMGAHASAQFTHAAAISGMQFPPLEHEARPTVDTAAAAYYLHRCPQTLRIWASRESGPLRPLRICGRLAWSTAEIRRLLGVAL